MSTAVAVVEPRLSTSGVRLLRRVSSFPTMLGSLLVLLSFVTVRARFNDPDMWWHLKTGEIIWTHHAILTTDLFSYTTNHHAWVPHEWLSQVSIFAAYRLAGYSGLMGWLCVFSAALLLCSYALCTLTSKNAKVGFVGAMLVWFFSTIGLAVRPQMIGYLLLIVELHVLELGRTRTSRWFWLLPPLFAVWVNCHGSFFLGMLVAAVYFFCSFFGFEVGSLVSERWDSRRRVLLGAAVLVSGAALFLNPDGLKQVLYPLDTMFKQQVSLQIVEEWKPLQVGGARGIGLLGVLGCIFLLVLVQRCRLWLYELMLLGLGTWAALSHERMLFVFGVLAAPILSRLLSPFWEGYKAAKDPFIANAIMVLLVLFGVYWTFPDRQNLEKQVREQNPIQAVEFLKQRHFTGRILNDYGYGGYLIWAAPEIPVFVDGRGDVFEWTGVLADYARWETLQEDPNLVLDKYRVEVCLLPKGSPMVRVMGLLRGWRQVYSDDMSVIFARAGDGALSAS